MSRTAPSPSLNPLWPDPVMVLKLAANAVGKSTAQLVESAYKENT